MTVWTVTFNDADGNGGTSSYVVGVFSSEELANQDVQSRQWPADWYDVDEWEVQ